jgi:Ni,Fe-hydrogenase I large subunit
MSRRVVGPFNRVEGDLEVTLDIADGMVQSAYVNAPMYRGFEQILRGKMPLDALALTPRICGICSVSQSVACAEALREAMGLSMPQNGRSAINLILANENLADHFTHFYLFFMPDFARPAYTGRKWHAAIQQRFQAMGGEGAREAVAVRAAFLNLMGYLAGKWPHTLGIQPGGSARPIEQAEKMRLFTLLKEFRAYLEKRLFGAPLEAIGQLTSAAQLQAWIDERPADSSDFRLFLEVAADLNLENLGRATDYFMSYGTYAQEGGLFFRRGTWRDGGFQNLATDGITEDITHAWMDGPASPQQPRSGVTQPLLDKPGAYSWCKAPRLAGQVVETGALARQVVNAHPLVLDLVNASGGNVRNRVIARLLELALVVPAMEKWVRELRAGEPFCNHGVLPSEVDSIGLTEAARGSLGHWLSVREGKIANYQIIAPTTWNFSPRDENGTPGALEQALAGISVSPEEDPPLAVQHVVRSFDPCMVCTVH